MTTSRSASPPASRARASTGCLPARVGRSASSPCRRRTSIPPSRIPRCSGRRWSRRASNPTRRSWVGDTTFDMAMAIAAGTRRAGGRVGLPFDSRAAGGPAPIRSSRRARALPTRSTHSSHGGRRRHEQERGTGRAEDPRQGGAARAAAEALLQRGLGRGGARRRLPDLLDGRRCARRKSCCSTCRRGLGGGHCGGVGSCRRSASIPR